MKLKATNPLVLFVGALAIGLAGCADDVIITEPPPPPPPPPPEAAEIAIVSIVNPDDGTEIGQSEADAVSGVIGVAINFDTGGFEAAALDVFVDGDKVPCQTFSGQAAVGFSADQQRVQCLINTDEGIGACTGSVLLGRFENGAHTISATLTLQDGSAVTATRAEPLTFGNSNSIIIVPNDIGPRVVGLDAQGWWGGPRDLTWFACPVIFSASLDDVCDITVVATDGMTLGGPSGTSSSETSQEPFNYTASYRDEAGVPVDADPLNEDNVEDSSVSVSPTTVLACDGTDISGSFSLIGDTRPIDLSAPLCDVDPCQVWIDDDYPINDLNAAGFTNNLFSGGDFDLRDGSGPPGALVDDDGVGMVLGVTTVLTAWDFADGDQDNIELFASPVFGVDDLTEDDACGDDGTTDPALGLNTFVTAYGQCAATGEEGAPVDAYFIEIAEVGDLLDNQLGDGTADLQIDDEFITELDAPSGIIGSGQLGADFTGPDIDPDEVMPEAGLVWNPDLTFDGVDPTTRGCDPGVGGNGLDQSLCENLMFEALDPDLASGDPGAGVEDTGCGPATDPATTECLDALGNGDLNQLDVEIDDSPGDAFNTDSPITARAWDTGAAASTPAADGMFASYICAPLPGGDACDGSNDGDYTVTIETPDKAQVENNVSELTLSFTIDTNQPVIGFGGITGLNSSNAATVQFVLDASVVDRNGDGTAVTSAVVQVTAIDAALGPPLVFGNCSVDSPDRVTEVAVDVTPAGGNDDATGNTVIVDVTSDVQANGGDFSQLFTAANLTGNAVPATAVTYCFTIIADDGAERKDGTDDGTDISAVAGKDFTWQ